MSHKFVSPNNKLEKSLYVFKILALVHSSWFWGCKHRLEGRVKINIFLLCGVPWERFINFSYYSKMLIICVREFCFPLR
jgi:hypothetical protein